MENVIKKRDQILQLLANKMAGFYLAGGTALSVFYFQHRESYDLDFFTQDYMRIKIARIVKDLSETLQTPIKAIGEQAQDGMAKMCVYTLFVDKGHSLKIDFVEDVFPVLKPFNKVNGINILSVEDIYLRKILATCGSFETMNDIGKKHFKGGRQEAKDFFDLYFLSKTFMPISKFAINHCNSSQRESIVIWFKTYDRLAIKGGLCEIRTNKNINYNDMEKHFKSEVEKMIVEEL